MLLKALLKKPVFVIGIILFGLFLAQDTTKKWWKSFSSRYIPNSCQSYVGQLTTKEQFLEGTEYICHGHRELEIKLSLNQSCKNDKKPPYVAIKNVIEYQSKAGDEESLQYIETIKITIECKDINIIGLVRGTHMKNYKYLKTTQDQYQFLQKHVLTQEILKNSSSI